MIVKLKSDYCPKYSKSGDSGCDVRAAEQVYIKAGGFAMVPTGLRIAMPPELDCQLRPRSSMTAKGLYAGLGTIDSGYRGEIKALIFNFSNEGYCILAGDRIGQLVFSRVERVEFERVDELPTSERGEGGFGSTGVA